MPLRRSGLAVDHGVPDADGAAALHLQARRVAHDVDRISAAAGALAANGAIAALIGVGGVAVERETHRAAAARAFKTHRHGSLRPQLLSKKDPLVVRRIVEPGELDIAEP